MTGYWINDATLVAWLAAFILTIPIVGYWIVANPRLSTARIVGWCFVAATVLFVERTCSGEPHGTRMLLIIGALLWSMKSVVYVEAGQDGKCKLTFWQWLGFCIGWFGMRAEVFRNVPGRSSTDWSEYIWRGLIRFFAGIALVVAAWVVAHSGSSVAADIAPWRLWTATVLLLPGLSLIVHFGCFNLVVGFWRYFGARCSSLFRAPLKSRSLSEFWGRRWNLAFSEMTALAVFRPLKQLPGNAKRVTIIATTGAFLFSGMLHELAISVPVGAGFGLPMLYFAIQGIGTLLEKRIAFLQSAFFGTIWTMVWVMLPLPILFHRPFLEGCVWPIIGV